MTSCHFSGWEQVKIPKYLAGKMAAEMRGTTCARTKTSKAPTRVTLQYIPYSVVLRPYKINGFLRIITCINECRPP